MIAPSSSGEELAPDSNAGYVDFYGYHCSAGGWIMVGWVLSETPKTFSNGMEGNPEARITFDGDELDGPVVIALYRREDLPDRGTGVVLFVPSPKRPLGRLVSAELIIGPSRYRLNAASGAARLRETDLVNRVRPILNDAARDMARMELSVLLSRLPYAGEDTVERLSDFIRIEIDEIIQCAPDGLVLIGWTLAAPNSVKAVQVRCGAHIAELKASDLIAIERHDVIEAIGKQHGLTDPSCGFMAFIPYIIHDDDPVYIQVETLRWEVGYKNVPRPRLRGMEALRRILDSFDVQYERVLPAFDRVVGPAFLRLNDERVRKRPTVTEVRFGNSPIKPRYSIIVPLYGRVDFMEYQIGLFATTGGCLDTELIYVLDDPRKEQELLLLAESLDLRFRIPFRLLLLSKNMGFAPASNIGLSRSHGTFVCFLNSDVFPGTADWLPRLADRLCSDESLGAVAPL
ncbi:MAG: glycosyltransferase [Alloacidobacterium sp.]